MTVYKRTLHNGSTGYQVANYSQRNEQGKRKRRLDSYATEGEAMEAAQKLVRQMSQLEVIGAGMTRDQSIEYASSVQTLLPYNIPLTSAASTIAESVKLVGDLSSVIAAVKFYKERHKSVTAKRVVDVLAELLAIKEARGASRRYVEDMRSRLGRFAYAFQKDAGAITTADLQAWFDGKKFGSQNYMGFRRSIHMFFKFCVTRGYALENPVVEMERIKVTHAPTQIFTAKEIGKLLNSASDAFRPCIAIGAFEQWPARYRRRTP